MKKRRRLSDEEISWEKAIDGYVLGFVIERRPPPCGSKHQESWWPDGRSWKCRLCHPPAVTPELPRF